MWSAKTLFNLIALASVLVLPGCGFQLRTTDISALEAISLTGSISAESRRALRQAFRQHGLATVPAAPEVVSVRLLDERSVRRPISTSARIDAAQYELRLEFDLELSLDGKAIAPGMTLVAERVYSVDSLNLSGSYEEQQTLMQEIRDELAVMIIRRIEAWLVAGNTP